MAFTIQAGLSIIVSVWAFLLAFEDSVGSHGLAHLGPVATLLKVMFGLPISTPELLVLVQNAAEIGSRRGPELRLPIEERPLTYKRSVCQLKLELAERVLAKISQIQAFNGLFMFRFDGASNVECRHCTAYCSGLSKK
jgi:hypothetical protein